MDTACSMGLLRRPESSGLLAMTVRLPCMHRHCEERSDEAIPNDRNKFIKKHYPKYWIFYNFLS
jgi:hypothetical protein